MQYNYNKHLKSNSANLSVHISKSKNTNVSFNNNIFKVSKDIFHSPNKIDFNCPDQQTKQHIGVFPKIEDKKILEMKKTTPTKFNSKSSSTKKSIFYEPLRDISYEGDERKIQLHNKKVKPIALFSSKINEVYLKSSNNSPRNNLNDNKSDNSNDNIISTKNINFINVYSSRKKENNKKDLKEEVINLNHSIDMNNLKEGKSFRLEHCDLYIKEKEEINNLNIKSSNIINNSSYQFVTHKSASPSNPSRTFTKENSFCSQKLNRLKSLTNAKKIYVESLEDLHFIYNNLYRQNRELAYKLDYEDKNVGGLDIDL